MSLCVLPPFGHNFHYILNIGNLYNTYLPMDTLALNGALNEFGHPELAEKYLGYFLETKINVSTGAIDYSLFGCDVSVVSMCVLFVHRRP